MPNPPEPSWRLTVAGIVTIVILTISGWSEITEKADKTETKDLRKGFTDLDKEHALTAQEIKSIAKGMDELKELMKSVDRNQSIILQKLMETHGNSYGPPAPSPNPLNR